MLGLLSLAINALVISFLAYATYLMSRAMLNSGAGVFFDMSWMLERTPARYYFAMFMLQTLLAVSAVAFYLKGVSNHAIMSFDILSYASILLLVLYHQFKVFSHPPVKAI